MGDLRSDIRDALSTYRCKHWRYEIGGGCDLIDVLTPPGKMTGKASDELDLLADHIAAEIAANHSDEGDEGE